LGSISLSENEIRCLRAETTQGITERETEGKRIREGVAARVGEKGKGRARMNQESVKKERRGIHSGGKRNN